jgi:hypothetical protein
VAVGVGVGSDPPQEAAAMAAAPPSALPKNARRLHFFVLVVGVLWSSGVTPSVAMSFPEAPGADERSGDVSCEFIRFTISSCQIF